MAEYKLAEGGVVILTSAQTWIPDDPANKDRVTYNEWLAAGGVPDPYVEPPPPPPAPPTPEQQVLFDHENRILAQEGLPPLSMADFVTKMNASAPAPKAKRGK